MTIPPVHVFEKEWEIPRLHTRGTVYDTLPFMEISRIVWGIIKFVLAVIFAVLGIITNVTPQQAQSNLSAWFSNPPAWMLPPTVDRWGEALFFILAALMVLSLAWPWISRLFKMPPRASIQKTFQAPTELIMAISDLKKQERLLDKQNLRREEISALEARQTRSDRISLRDASGLVYDRLSKPSTLWSVAANQAGGHFARSRGSRQEGVLNWAACSFAISKIPIYGRHIAGSSVKLIDPEEFNRGTFVNSGNEFVYHYERDPVYVDLQVMRSDVDVFVNAALAKERQGNSTIERQQGASPSNAGAKDAFEEGYNKAKFERNPNKEAATLRLAQLRSKGVVIRNEAPYVQDGNLQEWLGKVDSWMHEVINVIRHISEADSEWFKILDVVPLARVQVAIRLKNQTHVPIFVRTYNQHDFRLVRLDELLARYRGSAGHTLQ